MTIYILYSKYPKIVYDIQTHLVFYTPYSFFPSTFCSDTRNKYSLLLTLLTFLLVHLSQNLLLLKLLSNSVFIHTKYFVLLIILRLLSFLFRWVLLYVLLPSLLMFPLRVLLLLKILWKWVVEPGSIYIRYIFYFLVVSPLCPDTHSILYSFITVDPNCFIFVFINSDHVDTFLCYRSNYTRLFFSLKP